MNDDEVLDLLDRLNGTLEPVANSETSVDQMLIAMRKSLDLIAEVYEEIGEEDDDEDEDEEVEVEEDDEEDDDEEEEEEQPQAERSRWLS
jgi:hypothetical protein